MHDSNHVAVIDFGSQYTQLIVRRVRELGFFAKLYAIEDFPDIGKPGAIILSGGPKSTSEPDAPDLDFDALEAFNVPVLGVCYGMQLLNIKFGGSVEASDRREYGPANLFPTECAGLYEGVSAKSQVWMSHSDTVKNLPDGSVEMQVMGEAGEVSDFIHEISVESAVARNIKNRIEDPIPLLESCTGCRIER